MHSYNICKSICAKSMPNLNANVIAGYPLGMSARAMDFSSILSRRVSCTRATQRFEKNSHRDEEEQKNSVREEERERKKIKKDTMLVEGSDRGNKRKA